MSFEEEGHPYQYMVLDSGVMRIDMVTLRVKNPEAQILIIQPDLTTSKAPVGKVETDRMRASDLVKMGKGNEQVGNPVFLARIHLRQLELDRVRQLLLDFKMSAEEIEFIRTFLKIMIRNEQGKQELEVVKEDLARLDEIYRLCSLLAARDMARFDQELEIGLKPDVAREMAGIVAPYRKSAESKDEEIQYWEWEYRLNKMAGISE